MTRSDGLFSRYRIQLARKPVPTTSWKYLNRKLSLEEPTEFSLEEIQAVPGWRFLLWILRVSRLYMAAGLSESGEWVIVSNWAKEKGREEELLASVRGEEGGRSGRKKGSGVDMLIAHLREKEEVTDYDVIVMMLKACNIRWIRGVVDTWGEVDGHEKAKGAAGRGRKIHEPKSCRYCLNGLPQELAEAVACVKQR